MRIRLKKSFLLLLLLASAMLLLAGPTGCETYNTGSYSHSDNDHRKHDGEHHDREYDRVHYDYDYDRDYGRDSDRDEYRARAMRIYDYYPLRKVYYNRTTREYTYWNNGKLERRSELPSFIRESMGSERHAVSLPGDEPERYHERIKGNYPGGGRGEVRHRDWDRDVPRGARVYGDRDRARPYDYFPECGVFYNLDTREYSWQKNDRWERDTNVPDYIRENMGNRHERIYISGDRPDYFYDNVRRDFSH